MYDFFVEPKNRARGLKAAVTKRETLFSKFKDLEPAIPFFDHQQLYTNTKEYYENLLWVYDKKPIKNLDEADESVVKRLAVDYLIFSASGVEAMYGQLWGKVGRRELIDLITLKKLVLICETYPDLIDECNDRIDSLRFANEFLPVNEPDYMGKILSTIPNPIKRRHRYRAEWTGTLQYKRSDQGTITKKHGEVVDALRIALSKKSIISFNDLHRDLYIKRGGNYSIAFEVKTDTSTQSIATAIGQLIWYYRKEKKKPKCVIVIPGKLSIADEKSLKRKNIYLLQYYYDHGNPVFIDLESIL